MFTLNPFPSEFHALYEKNNDWALWLSKRFGGGAVYIPRNHLAVNMFTVKCREQLGEEAVRWICEHLATGDKINIPSYHRIKANMFWLDFVGNNGAWDILAEKHEIGYREADRLTRYENMPHFCT